MNLKKKFGLRIKELRKKYGYTQEKLAELVDIAVKTQSCIERGINFPSPDLIERYASVLNIEEDELFKFTSMTNIKQLKQQIFSMINNSNDKEVVTIYKFIKNYLY